MTRARWLLFLVGSLILLGLATRSSTVVAMTFPLLGYVMTSYARSIDPPHINSSRAIEPNPVVGGREAVITLSITNEGDSSTEVTIDDEVQITAHRMQRTLIFPDGDPTALLALEPNQTVELVYSATGARGKHFVGPVRVLNHETLGLRGSAQQVGSAGELLVEPERATVRAQEIHPERTRGFAGPIPARLAGAGVNFFTMRDYQQGDRLRAINWRVTERLSAGRGDLLYSNVFEQHRIADIGFILDARAQADVSIGNRTLFEESVRATGSLADSFLGAGHRVGLLVYGSGVDSVFPGYGKTQRERIIRALSKAKPGSHFLFNDLQNLPTRLFPVSSQIVFVGPCHRKDIPAIVSLRALGYAVMVVSPSAIAMELEHHPVDNEAPSDRLAIRFAQIERASILQDLKREGINVIDWDPSTSLHAAVQRAAIAHRGQRTIRTA
jgi:uncharacterized protein (DUF58 family)